MEYDTIPKCKYVRIHQRRAPLSRKASGDMSKELSECDSLKKCIFAEKWMEL